MRKILLLASMLALALFVASPALAQDSEVEGVCHIPPGNPENAHFIPADDSSFAAHEAHGDDPSTLEECEGNADDNGDDGAMDDGDDVVVSGDENNNNNENNVDVDVNVDNEVIVNLANFNANVNFINIGGTKVEDFNKDGVITVHECKQVGVSKKAALVFHKKAIVEKKFVVEGETIVTGDTSVVTKDVAVVTGDTTTTTTATLPETGGSSLLALGAGALLVAGGLLARRIVR